MSTSTRKCRHCKTRRPLAEMQIIKGGAYCIEGDHAVQYAFRAARKAQEARKRREKAEAKERLKTRSDWIREAQNAFNRYIRARDARMPCISCGAHTTMQSLTGGAWDCGHYRSTGAAPHLRFNVFNAAKQCKRCNRDLSGNTVEMRKGMILRFGLAIVERVENSDTPQKYDIGYLQRLKRLFARRARHVERMRERKHV